MCMSQVGTNCLNHSVQPLPTRRSRILYVCLKVCVCVCVTQVGGNVGWSIMSKVITVVKQTTGIRTLENHKVCRAPLCAHAGQVVLFCGVTHTAGIRTLENHQVHRAHTGCTHSHRAPLCAHNGAMLLPQTGAHPRSYVCTRARACVCVCGLC